MIRPVSKVFVTRIHAPANNLCRIPCASLEVFVLVRSVSAKREIRLQLDDGTVGSSPMKAHAHIHDGADGKAKKNSMLIEHDS